MSVAFCGPSSNTSCRVRCSSEWWASTSRTRPTHCATTPAPARRFSSRGRIRSEEHTSELQSPCNLVCRLLLEKKKNKNEKEYNDIRKDTYTADVDGLEGGEIRTNSCQEKIDLPDRPAILIVRLPLSETTPGNY